MHALGPTSGYAPLRSVVREQVGRIGAAVVGIAAVIAIVASIAAGFSGKDFKSCEADGWMFAREATSASMPICFDTVAGEEHRVLPEPRSIRMPRS